MRVVHLNGNRREHPLPASRVDSAVGYTLGVAFVINDMALVIWGGNTFTVPVPETLQGKVMENLRVRRHPLFGNLYIYYPKNRLLVLVTDGLMFIGLWPLLHQRRDARKGPPAYGNTGKTTSH